MLVVGLLLLGVLTTQWSAIRSGAQRQFARVQAGVGDVGGKVLDAASSLAVAEDDLAASTPTPVVVLAQLPDPATLGGVILAPTTVGAAVGGGSPSDVVGNLAAAIPAATPEPPTPTTQPTATPEPTATVAPPTATATSAPPTPTRVRATATRVLATATRVPATATRVLATATRVPATATRVPTRVAATATPQPTATSVPATATRQGTASGTRNYVVQSGDNWYNIAQRYGITQETLAAYNDMTPSDILQVDQTLQIPPEGAVVELPTATATPIPPTPTRAVPTNTPTASPTPTVIVRQPAPVLLSPPSGDGFTAATQPVLRWDYADLGPNDYYYLVLRFTKLDGSAGYAEERTTAVSYTVPLWIFDMAFTPDRLTTWSVQIRRMGADGQEIDLSLFSESRIFYWR